MKLQLAIDRVSIADAIQIINQTKEYVDIIEIGTSLIKDFGLDAVRQIRKAFPDLTLLADIKTIDEAEYEFRAVYEAGADIATVMGASALSSIRVCQEVASSYDRQYMIDLLEISDAKLELLKQFSDGIFCIHLAIDDKGVGLEKLANEATRKLGAIRKIAIAGGVTIETLPQLKGYNIGIAIVGGGITKAFDRTTAAKKFYDSCN